MIEELVLHVIVVVGVLWILVGILIALHCAFALGRRR